MKYLYALLFAFLAIQVSAQDKIITIDSDTILCKIMERGTSEVSYVLYSDLSGPARSLAYTQIHQIIMQSGAVTTHAPLRLPEAPMPKPEKKKKEKKEPTEDRPSGSWNRHSIRLEAGASSSLAITEGFAADLMLSYAIGLTPNKSLRLTGIVGYGYSSGYYRGWTSDIEYNNYGLGLSYHYTWLNRSRVKLHSGVGLGYVLYETYGSGVEFNPRISTNTIATEQQAISYFASSGYDGVMPDIELIGADFFIGNHFSITTRLGFGYAGLANLGFGFSF